MLIEYSTICDIGRHREINQDSIYAYSGNNWAIFVIADGMGGHSEGERASTEITNAYKMWIDQDKENLSGYSLKYLTSLVKQILLETNERIYHDNEDGIICGSTAVILFIVNGAYILLSVGDSRCYELRHKFLRRCLFQLNTDEVNIVSPYNKKLTNAVGVRVPLNYKIMTAALPSKSLLLLCTDGVYNYCSVNQLCRIMSRSDRIGLEGAVNEIKGSVYLADAKDNFSAILVRVNSITKA